MINPAPYIGRFAPTPSGFLHFGSLLAALASFLDARAVGGRWLLRIEDLDPPREVPGASTAILHELENHGLHWDGEILYQSQRSAAYEAAIEQLCSHQLAYACSCSRKQLQAHPGPYPGFCRHRLISGSPPTAAAIRLKVAAHAYSFIDRCQGYYQQNLAQDVGDFIIQRKDGWCAYQLAVVIDDAWQGVTDVVRGADLLDSTPRQLYLQECLDLPQPRYLHLPVIIQPDGHKLGKRYRSPPLDSTQAASQLLRGLRALQQHPPPELSDEPPESILAWAINHWRPERIPNCFSLVEAALK